MRSHLSSWTLALGLVLGGAAAHAASSADPTGAAPVGIVTKSESRGPKLVGVIVVEFVGVGAGVEADGARVTLRLRRGSALSAMFAEVDGPLDTENTVQVQTAIFDALEAKVKKAFFADECGSDGLGCPDSSVILKSIEEFALTDDGVENQFFVADVTVALDD